MADCRSVMSTEKVRKRYRASFSPLFMYLSDTYRIEVSNKTKTREDPGFCLKTYFFLYLQ